MLVRPAAQNDPDIPAAVLVENGSDEPRLNCQVSAVDRHGANALRLSELNKRTRELRDPPSRTCRARAIFSVGVGAANTQESLAPSGPVDPQRTVAISHHAGP